MRLNKFLASCGIASRRKCESLILQGKVEVNGKIITSLATNVEETDSVFVNKKQVFLQSFDYFMLNKPVGYVTTTKDPQKRKTVMEFVPKQNRLFPVGRLDQNTCGLLLFTNDGDLANKLMHPSFELGKTYVVSVNKKISQTQVQRLKNGVDIGGFVTSKAKVVVLKNAEQAVLKITIHEGKNRQIRRMIEAVGLKVKALERVAIGKLELGNLKVGEIRKLLPDEINYLKEA